MSELLPIFGIVGAALVLGWLWRRRGPHPEEAAAARRRRAPIRK